MATDDYALYNDAVSALYSPIHQARTKEALKRSSVRRKDTVQDMRTYMDRIQLSFPHDVSIIHITGTKGKGSTACFCESILRERYHLTTGLFTSPHLVDIRERIRINGQPVSKQVFAQAYYDVRRRLELFSQEENGLPQIPGYFRMLTLMALYVFAKFEQKIDAIILEVGMGGRYDATNVFDMNGRNVVCGVTLLDLDHTRVLGNTLEQIAWEKGGIFQVYKGNDPNHETKRPDNSNNDTGTSDSNPAKPPSNGLQERRFFALGTNPPAVLSVLGDCAAIEGRGQELHVVHEGQTVPLNAKLGLEGSHQRINAELAANLCESLVEKMPMSPLDEGREGLWRALAQASWPGRCQSVSISLTESSSSSTVPIQINLRCDGAHTTKSIAACLSWFQSFCQEDDILERVLIFNCSHERNPVPLLKLLQSLSSFDSVYFCRADTERPSMVTKSTAQELLLDAGETSSNDDTRVKAGGNGPLSPTWQDTLASVWTQLEINKDATICSKVTTNLSVSEAIERMKEEVLLSCRKEGSGKIEQNRCVEVFVTGSLYIVGSALDAVGWVEDEIAGELSGDN